MALEPAEATEVYDRLADALKELGLTWIVEQVEDQLALGHIGTRKLTVQAHELFVPDESILQSRTTAKTSRATFVVSRPFEPVERLTLLLDCIEIGVAQLADIASRVSAFAQNEIEGGVVQFRPETDLDTGFDLTQNELLRTQEAAATLRSLLAEISDELEDAN